MVEGIRRLSFLWAATAALAFCVLESPAAAQKTVVATIAQIGEPMRVIAGNRIKVLTLMSEGVDPHLYRLTRSDIAKLRRANLILYNGLHLEAQMTDMLARFAKRKPVVAVGEHV